MGFLEQLTETFNDAISDPSFWKKYRNFLLNHASPLRHASGLTNLAHGANIWLKHENFHQHGSQNIYSIVGHVLLAQRMGRTEIITDCGSAHHGLACAMACAKENLKCTIYMGAQDASSQGFEIASMRDLGAEVVIAGDEPATLRTAIAEALRAATARYENAYYIMSTPAGPHPYPMIFRTFQSFMGQELETQMRDQVGPLPDAVVAPVGGSAVGMFYPFLSRPTVKLVCVEAAGSAALSNGSLGVYHGSRTHVLQDDDGQILPSHSICPDMNYPAVGPDLANWKENGRMETTTATDEDAMEGKRILGVVEGVTPGLDAAHTVHTAVRLGRKLGYGANIVILVNGYGFIDGFL